MAYMTTKELLQLVLDALNLHGVFLSGQEAVDVWANARRAVEAELAKPEPEPFAWTWTDILGERGLDYIEPDKKSWVKKFNVEPLYLHPKPAIPEGWKLVPIEPTPEMKKAAHISLTGDEYGWYISAAVIAGCKYYQAMLATAPEYKE